MSQSNENKLGEYMGQRVRQQLWKYIGTLLIDSVEYGKNIVLLASDKSDSDYNTKTNSKNKPEKFSIVMKFHQIGPLD